MKSPRQETNWRPAGDISGGFELDPALLPAEVYLPSDQLDALAYVRELALQVVVDYDGHPALQAEIIQEEATRMFPCLFGAVVVPEQTAKISPLERHHLPSGDINWNAVAKATIYLPSITTLTD